VVHSVVEVVALAFVHGHARDAGWVMAHLRRPTDAAEGQLPLLPLPRPRESDLEDCEVEPALGSPGETLPP